jgi:hypothetical protein
MTLGYGSVGHGIACALYEFTEYIHILSTTYCFFFLKKKTM